MGLICVQRWSNTENAVSSKIEENKKTSIKLTSIEVWAYKILQVGTCVPFEGVGDPVSIVYAHTERVVTLAIVSFLQLVDHNSAPFGRIWNELMPNEAE